MKSIITVLTRVLAVEFYLQHAVPFLVTFGLTFGFMSKIEHIALAEFFISQPIFALIPVALWAIYAVRVINFNAHILRQDENNFLYDLVFISGYSRVAALTQIVITQLLPVLLYGIVLITFAAINSKPLVAFILLISIALLLASVTFGLLYTIRHPNRERRVWYIQRYINRVTITPEPLFFIGWAVRHRAMLLFWLKVISCLLLFGILKLYTTDDYDLRLLGLGVLFAFALSIELVSELHKFNNLHFALLRQLPLSPARRVASFLITWMILILPETGLLITRFPAGFGISGFLSAYGFALSIPFLFYNLFYVKSWQQEDIMKIGYCFGIGWFLLVLFKVPLAALAIANIVIGVVLLKRYWYSFEYLAENTTTEPIPNDRSES